MKKYIKPISNQYEVATEGIIATSLPIGDKPGSEQLSIRHEGWSSEDWSNNAEEVDEY